MTKIYTLQETNTDETLGDDQKTVVISEEVITTKEEKTTVAQKKEEHALILDQIAVLQAKANDILDDLNGIESSTGISVKDKPVRITAKEATLK